MVSPYESILGSPLYHPEAGGRCDISEDLLAGAEKRTGGARIASVIPLLGGELLGTKVLNRGLEVDVEDGGRGLADLYFAPGANLSIASTMAEMLNLLWSPFSPSLAFAAATCSSTSDLCAEMTWPRQNLWHLL